VRKNRGPNKGNFCSGNGQGRRDSNPIFVSEAKNALEKEEKT